MDKNLKRVFWVEVRRATGTMLRAGVFFLLVGWLGAEYIAHALGGGGQPTMLTHLVAVLFGIILSYAAMLTVAIAAGMRGIATLAPHGALLRPADAPVVQPIGLQLVPQPLRAERAEHFPDLTSAAS